GFAYGLDRTSRDGGGHLGLALGGDFRVGGTFSVTALVKCPERGETVTLKLPGGLELVNGKPTQEVPPLPPGATTRISPVTWRVLARKPGAYELKVQYSAGISQTDTITVRGKKP